MKLSTTKNRGGRPRMHEVEPGERIPVSLRVTPEMKHKLDEACLHSGRSMAQELEFRVALSLDRASLLDEILSLRMGPQVAGIARRILDDMAFHDDMKLSTVEIDAGVKAFRIEFTGPGERRSRYTFEGAADLEPLFQRLLKRGNP